ncbi:MAG TPA: hypothetical protein PK694_03020 [Rhodospirillales bacterium]|nr:hypothetical protein [Rhodospirillales bacterium]
MAHEPLPEDLKADGAAVLALASKLGMAPREAAWLYEHDFGAWRYYLVTPVVRAVGPMEAYGALAETLPRTSLHPRFNVIDVHLVDPSEEMADLLASCRSAAAGADPLVARHNRNGTVFDAYVYPVEPPGDTDAKSLKKTFRRSLRDFMRVAAA